VKRSFDTFSHRVAMALRGLVIVPLKLYQRFVSPALPRRCKYEPTCSAYAVQAVRELGVLRGTVLAAWRVARCNPFSHGGYDPVEAQTLFRRAAAPPPSTAARASASPSGHGGKPA
jgi:putative membrane protein insertion efficiency factor